MGMLCSSFAPSHFMLKYLSSYLLDNVLNVHGEYKEPAEYCMKRLQRTIYHGNRHLVPSLGELSYIKVILKRIFENFSHFL